MATAKQIHAEYIRGLGQMRKRIKGLGRMYELLDELATRTHSPQRPWLLSELQSSGLKFGGVYFFYEDSEHRSDSGAGDRIVHVGQSANLYRRLLQHKRGDKANSIFCKLVGLALSAKNGKDKRPLNKRVTETLGNMWVLCLPIEEKALRGWIERNAIALLSNCYKQQSIDSPSKGWLGHHCEQETVPSSGLWNQQYVDGTHDPAFLDTLNDLILGLKETT